MKEYEVTIQFFDSKNVKANNEEEALEKAFSEYPKDLKDLVANYFSNQSYATELEDSL